jgi:endoglucanase
MNALMATAASVALAATPGNNLPWVKASGTSFVDGAGKPLRLRGINFGNWLIIEGWIIELNRNAPRGEGIHDERELWTVMRGRFGAKAMERLRRAHRETWITEADFRLARDAGFNFVRVPFWHELIEHDSRPGVIDAAGFEWLDKAVRWATKYGLWVLLDLHGAPGSQNPWDHSGVVGRNKLFSDAECQSRTARIWKAVAARYRDNPAVLGYDLLNEPNGGKPEELGAMHDKLYRAVREVDPRHLVVIEDGLHGLETMPPPSKYGWENVAYSTHFYLFEAKDEAPHEKYAAEAGPRWRAKQAEFGVPLYIGEFNPINPSWGLSAMARYAALFEKEGWAWSPWTWKKIEAGRPSLWGIYRNEKPWKGFPDFRRAPLGELEEHLRSFTTGRLSANREYVRIVREAGR